MPDKLCTIQQTGSIVLKPHYLKIVHYLKIGFRLSKQKPLCQFTFNSFSFNYYANCNDLVYLVLLRQYLACAKSRPVTNGTFIPLGYSRLSSKYKERSLNSTLNRSLASSKACTNVFE